MLADSAGLPPRAAGVTSRGALISNCIGRIGRITACTQNAESRNLVRRAEEGRRCVERCAAADCAQVYKGRTPTPARVSGASFLSVSLVKLFASPCARPVKKTEDVATVVRG